METKLRKIKSGGRCGLSSPETDYDSQESLSATEVTNEEC